MAPFLLTLLLAAACAPPSGQNTTVSQSDRDGNLTRAGDPSATEASTSILSPVTAAMLFEGVTERARRLAEIPYRSQNTALPAALERMDYDQYRSIRFRPELAVWHNETPFEVQLFHPGALYREPVRIHLVEEQQIAAHRFDTNQFRYDGRASAIANIVDPELGYAGFRIHYPLNDAAVKDEVVSFLGASYFRLLGRGHVYGLSSRGLAVNIATEGGEEFPSFREFWLVQPGPEATSLTFYALLDSPSVTGAYRFNLLPGAPSVLEVDARLYARHDVAKLGVAPLSSMFLYGPDRMPAFDDFRPQVHDSDGLLMHTAAGEWIWRPLYNGPGLQVTSLRDVTPQGFGLVQRDRDFDNYLDLEANYHRRPSKWIALGEGDWGSGGVELLTIPTDSEFNDNIAAYWVPDEPFMAGDERFYRYQLTAFDNRIESQMLAEVERTRIGRDALPGQSDSPPPSQRRVVVDFSGGELSVLDRAAPVQARLESSSGQISDVSVQSLPDGRGWRAVFRLAPDGNRPADMRLYLTLDDRQLTETWSHVWYPERVQ